MKRAASLARLSLMLAALQALRFGLKSLCFLFVQRTGFTDRCASAAAMALLALLVPLIARRRHVKLSIFPKRFGAAYIIATAAFAALLASSPFLGGRQGAIAWVLPLAVGVITPIYEELLFRGYVWQRVEGMFRSRWATCAATALLFALWHLGYADSLALRAQAPLSIALMRKALVGLGFGAALGALRAFAGNCYATALAHGALNLLG